VDEEISDDQVIRFAYMSGLVRKAVAQIKKGYRGYKYDYNPLVNGVVFDGGVRITHAHRPHTYRNTWHALYIVPNFRDNQMSIWYNPDDTGKPMNSRSETFNDVLEDPNMQGKVTRKAMELMAFLDSEARDALAKDKAERAVERREAQQAQRKSKNKRGRRDR
jgi:hypothetical protein